MSSYIQYCLTLGSIQYLKNCIYLYSPMSLLLCYNFLSTFQKLETKGVYHHCCFFSLFLIYLFWEDVTFKSWVVKAQKYFRCRINLLMFASKWDKYKFFIGLTVKGLEVNGESAGLAVAFATLSTHVRSITGVCSHMTCQLNGLCKGGFTVLTHVHFTWHEKQKRQREWYVLTCKDFLNNAKLQSGEQIIH